MSGPRLYWPKKLGAVPGFPAELVEPLARLGLKTVGDLVARVQKHNPGMTPPAFAFGLNVRNACWFPINDPQPAKRAGEAVAAYLGYGEYGCPRDWTDPPKAKQPTPEPEPTIMPTVKQLPTASLTLHEEHARVPMMSAKLYKVFAADIKANGVKEPIKVIPGTKIVIDGRTRLQAATDAGLESVPVEDADLGEFSPVMFMLRVAHLRRSLNPVQAAKVGNEIKKQLKDEMRRLKKEGGKKGGEKSAEVRSGKAEPKDAAEVPQASAAKKTRAPGAREQAAALSGASPKAIDLAGKIEQKAPEVYAKLGTDEIPTLAAAKKAAKIEEPKKDKPAAPKLGKPLKEIAGFPAKLAAAADDCWISTDTQLSQLIEKDPDKKWKGKSHREKIFLALDGIPNADPAECQAGADAFMDYLYPGRKKPAAKSAEPTVAETICATLHELKPCPFCGTAERLEMLGKSTITCHECGSTGPIKSSEDAARAAWNHRRK